MFCLGEAVCDFAASGIMRVELFPDEHASKIQPRLYQGKILTFSVKRG
jgi:hypothetical protein